MKKHFFNYIEQNSLTNMQEKILVGLSGGRDSIFMASMFLKNEFNIGIAHCNFQLRDKESDNEQRFVKEFAEENNIPFYTTNFNTKEYAKENKLSTQMAARELRYNWFEEIRTENNYHKIAIAHNKNDSVETFLINLTRGTGIKGLTGIKPLNNNIIRPILFVERNKITEYLTQNNISWKDDSSNNSGKYTRNFIRHNIIPQFNELNNNFLSTMTENIEKLDDVFKIYKREIELNKRKILICQTDKILINIELLKSLEPLKTYLYEVLKDFNFTAEQIPNIIEITSTTAGKSVSSPTHRILKDRNYLIITEIKKKERNQEFIIKNGTIELKVPLHIHFDLFNKNIFKLQKNNTIASLDYNKIKFPLKLRKWKNGDKFMPFGMNNLKKLSDFFSDNKLSLVEKENLWLLTDNNENIIWIVNYRADNRFKIDKSTTKILQVSTY